MTKRINLVPAYGRDYRSRKAIIADLQKNMDFSIRDISCPWDGKVANLRDLTGSYDTITVRYSKLTKVCSINLKELK